MAEPELDSGESDVEIDDSDDDASAASWSVDSEPGPCTTVLEPYQFEPLASDSSSNEANNAEINCENAKKLQDLSLW